MGLRWRLPGKDTSNINYSESLRYFDSFLNLERITFTSNNYQWNLDRMRVLLRWFGHPEKSLFPILIAGTKGKGSTGFFLESILRAAGIRTGFYSSPHLEDPRERIRIQGKMVSKAVWTRGVAQIKRVLDRKKLPRGLGNFTYFELLTLLAVLLYKEEGMEAGVFEVGLGGRLDATNALGARLVILTPIHMDHEAILGNTIAKIAAEKAGVIHRGTEVVMSPQSSEAYKVILSRVCSQKAQIYPIRQGWKGKTGLRGDFQRINAAAAAEAAKCLRAYDFAVTDKAIQEGLRASSWPGRMELFPGALGKGVDLLLDGAHNPASVEALGRSLGGKQSLLIFSASRDKNSAVMLEILGKFFKDVILCSNPSPRTQEMETLIAQARPWFRGIFPEASVPETLARAKSLSKAGDTVVATGSFYLIGEVRKYARHSS